MQEAPTVDEYVMHKAPLHRFINKFEHRKKVLKYFAEWWDARKEHIMTAFKPNFWTPTTNLQEVDNSRCGVNQALIDAAYEDVCQSAIIEADLEALGQGAHSFADQRGPSMKTRINREKAKQMKRAKSYSNELNDESHTHRPDKRKSMPFKGPNRKKRRRSVFEYSESESSEGECANTDCHVPKGKKHPRRKGPNRFFVTSLEKAKKAKFEIKFISKTSDKLVVKCKDYNVEIGESNNCSCMFFTQKHNNSLQLCKHLVYIYINVLSIAAAEEACWQVAFRAEERRELLEHCKMDNETSSNAKYEDSHEDNSKFSYSHSSLSMVKGRLT
jgi:hypothetical protein